jgi:hypothetical protein
MGYWQFPHFAVRGIGSTSVAHQSLGVRPSAEHVPTAHASELGNQRGGAEIPDQDHRGGVAGAATTHTAHWLARRRPGN